MKGRADDLSGKYWNELLKEVSEWAEETLQEMLDAFNVGGYPPFHYPVTDRIEYNNLSALRAAGSELYWNDPTAVARLEVLARKYGPPVEAERPPTPSLNMLLEDLRRQVR